MSNSHKGHHHQHTSASNLKVAFLLNLGFTVIEIIGGLWTNSIAILTDALHDGGDCASLGLAWYFDMLSQRGRTPEHTYGYKRYRLLGGLITGLVLIGGIGFIVWNAVARLMSPEPVNAPGMMVLAVVGILVNGAAVWRVKKGSSLTEQVVSWHLLEDTLGWGAVLVGAGVMAIWEMPIIDPLLSIGISLFVLWNIARNLSKVIKVFLQKVPETFDIAEFENTARSIYKVRDTHHVHVWSLDGESHVVSLHLLMAGDSNREEVTNAKRMVRDSLDPEKFTHVTIDVELEGEECTSRE